MTPRFLTWTKKSTVFTFTEMRNRGEGGRLLGGERKEQKFDFGYVEFQVPGDIQVKVTN